MKLLLCKRCGDVLKLVQEHVSTCLCGESAGFCLSDDVTVDVVGPSVVLGLLNSSLAAAVRDPGAHPNGTHFTAFVVPPDSPTVRRSA